MEKIAILTPCYNGKRDEKTEECILKCKSYFKNFEFYSFTTEEVYIHRGRTTLLNDLIERDALEHFSYVLWLDSDVYFEPKDLSKLIESVSGKNLGCVSGVYFNRHRNHHPMYCYGDGYYGLEWDKLSNIPNKIFEVDGLGFGFLLMKIGLIHRYVKEYPYQKWFDSSNWYPTRLEEKAIFTIGEDVDFCKKLRKLGYKIWVDGTIKLSHKGIVYDDYVKWKKENFWHPHCASKVLKY